MVVARHRFLEALAVFSFGLILFTSALSQQEIIGFEARFYLFVREMWLHGPSWFPTTYGNPYPDYPGTSTWLIYEFSKLVGVLNKLTAVLPTAIASSVTLAATYLIGALHDRRWGLCAVFFMLLTNTFVMEARTISPDQYVAMVTTLSFYVAYSSVLLQKNKRLWCIPFLLVAGFACRGPIGLVIPAGVLCVFYLLEKNVKLFFISSFVALLLLIVCSAALLTVAYHVGGMSFVQDVLHMEVSGRLQDATLPWYFYFVESIGAYAVTYPLAILFAIGLGRELFKCNLSPDLKLMQKLIGWALIILIGLSIPAGKKIRYILAFVPAVSLICAYLWVSPPRKKYVLYLRRLIYWFCYFLPLLGIAATLYVELSVPFQHFSVIIPYATLILLLLFLQWIAIVCDRYKYLDDLGVIAVAALTFVTAYILMVEPINLALNRTRDFVQSVEELRHQHHAGLAFYQENPDAVPIKYLVNMPREDQPIFVNQPNALLEINAPMFFITSAEYFTQLSNAMPALFNIIATGNVGHEPMVVFERKH